MIRTTKAVWLAALGLSLIGGTALAAPMMPSVQQPDDLLQRVQARDADVFYDGNGNEVIVDRQTGEVVSVRPARRQMREANPGRGYQRQRQRELRRMRQWQEQQQGYDDYDNGSGAYGEYPDDGGYAAAPDDGYAPDTDDGADDAYGGAYGGRDVFPAAPGSGGQPVRKPSGNASRTPAPAKPANETLASTEPPAARPGSVTAPATSQAREDVATLQVLLDRAGASPGAIDGHFGGNVDKALLAYRAITGIDLKSTDAALIQKELKRTGGAAFTSYTLTNEDVAGPFVASVPADYSAKAKLDRLGYTSVPEMLGERFHMDEKYLRQLNPDANFNRVGTVIKVANVGKGVTGTVARIIADKGNKQVRVLDANNKLIAAYPATIGSTDTPSPTGIHNVSRVVLDPNYTYNPKINFQQGDNKQVLTIPPGPNGPVGSVWIALDKPTYGIHGTPDPSKIGKTESHGCVRLTNWDARELAKMVTPGVPVEFLE